MPNSPFSRRAFLAGAAGALVAAAPPAARKAQVAITLDLEMSRNFPTWDQTEWDYEKGNLDEPTRKYAAEAARRVKKHGGRVFAESEGPGMGSTFTIQLPRAAE